MIMSDHPVSTRSAKIQQAESFRMLFDFARRSGYQERRLEPGVLDFTFGDPHELPSARVRRGAARGGPCRRTSCWFAYKFSQVAAQEAAAASLVAVAGRCTWPRRPDPDDHRWLRRDRDRPLKSVADPGDEVVFSLPPWFLYEALVLEAGLVPVKVRCRP